MAGYVDNDPTRDGIDRRGFLKCMAWAGTGLLCTINGGILTSLGLPQAAEAKGKAASWGSPESVTCRTTIRWRLSTPRWSRPLAPRVSRNKEGRMTTQYRLIHHGWTAMAAALAVALAPALTRPSAAGDQVKKINGSITFHAATTAAFTQPKPDAADSSKPLERAADTKQQVTIDNFSFVPKTLTVPVGTTVTWTNHDDVPHTVVSTKKRFASPALDTDERFSYRFTAPGTYPYYCSVHPMMTGTVVVK
jgi:plastocyanin